MTGSSNVRERFEGHLPKYGKLWRALAAAEKKKAGSAAADAVPPLESGPTTSKDSTGICSQEESTNDNNAVDQDRSELQTSSPPTFPSPSPSPSPSQTLSSNIPSLLPAILGGKAISLRVPQNHDESCAVAGCIGGCAEPIFEDGTGTATNDDAKDNKFIQDVVVVDEEEDDDDEDVVIVDTSFSPSTPSKDGGPSDEQNDDNKSTSASESSASSSSSVPTPRRPRRNVRRNIASASGWRRRSDSILSSSDDDSFNNDTTSEEEWIDGDGDGDGDTDDVNKARSAPAGSFATPVARTTSKPTTKNVLKEEEQDDDDVIILSDDDEEEDINSATSESIGGGDFSSEYIEDSFVVSDGIGSSSNGSNSSDDDVEIVSPTKKKISMANSADAAPKGRKKLATQPPKTQKTKPKPKPKPKPKQPTNKKSATSYQDVSRTTFARKREEYTRSTFAEFNTKVFNSALSSVEVVWSKRLKTSAGLTRLKRVGTSDSMRRIATIELSTKILDNLERLRATLLHEMCHAAGWLVDGVHKPPHGKVFKKWANLSMRRIRDVEVTTTHDYVIRFKFAWKCKNTACGSIIKRHSRSVDPNKHCCGSCKGRLMEIEVPGSKNDTETVGHTPKKKRAPTGFSLFVQQHSKAVRERLVAERGSSVTQPEVMKECGKMWRLKKEGLEKSTGNGNGGSKNNEANDENLPYDLNRAINDMENRLNGLTM